MGTRSLIAIETDNGSVYAAYCHWDGYPSNNGAILHEHYRDTDKTRMLIELGSMSSLAPSIECPAGHSFDTPVDGHTVFYARDRGESRTEQVYNTREEFFAAALDGWEEWVYLKLPDSAGGEWLVSEVGGDCGPMGLRWKDAPEGSNWRLLCDVLAQEDEEE